MKKFAAAILCCLVFVVYVQQVMAEKRTPHKEYATTEIKECNSCHIGEGVAVNHDADFVRSHGKLASKADKNCGECHDKSFCYDCHFGGGVNVALETENFRKDHTPKTHNGNFMEIHPLKAKDNPQTCTRCHDYKQFCAGCHAKYKPQNLMFDSHRQQFSDIKMSSLGPQHAIFKQKNGSYDTTKCAACHPNAQFPSNVWRSKHASEARRNLQTCQTCHPDGKKCLECHNAKQGLKINPHPRGWNSVKNNLKTNSGGKTCRICHDKGTY